MKSVILYKDSELLYWIFTFGMIDLLKIWLYLFLNLKYNIKECI